MPSEKMVKLRFEGRKVEITMDGSHRKLLSLTEIEMEGLKALVSAYFTICQCLTHGHSGEITMSGTQVKIEYENEKIWIIADTRRRMLITQNELRNLEKLILLYSAVREYNERGEITMKLKESKGSAIIWAQ